MPTILPFRLSWQGHRSGIVLIQLQPHVLERVPPISRSVLFAQFQLIETAEMWIVFLLFGILSSEESRIVRLFMILLDVGLSHSVNLSPWRFNCLLAEKIT